MNQRSKQKKSMIMVFTILLLVALNSVFFYFKIDLTTNQVHTMTSTSKELLQKIDRPFQITYYLSPKIKDIDPETQDVEAIEDFLISLSSLSPHIQYTQVDPDTMEGQKLGELGLLPQSLEVSSRSSVTWAEVYSGIVLDYQGRTERIPFISRSQPLEYELISRILNLVEAKKPKVGLLVGNFEESVEENFVIFEQNISEHYDLRILSPGEIISDDIDVLVVAGNKDLEDRDVYHINQYMMNGGRAFFAVDGMALNPSQSGLPAFPLRNTPMIKLLDSWGIEVSGEFLLDRVNKRIPVGQGNFRPYPLFIRILPEGVNSAHPITSQFLGLDLYFASALKWDERNQMNTTTLVNTSVGGWIVPNLVSLEPNRVDVSMMTATEEGSFPVAVLLEGILPSAFPEGPPNDVAPVGVNTLESSEDVQMVIVGDSDFLKDIYMYWAWENVPNRPNQGLGKSMHNIQFFTNVIEFLSPRSDLLKIKSRPFRNLALTKVDESNRQWINGLLIGVNVFFIPSLFLVVGALYLFRRRKKAQRAPLSRMKKETK